MAWSKLGYLTCNMRMTPRKRLIKLINADGFNDFNRYINENENYESIFREINQICIDNETFPLFKDPSNIEECFKIRNDLVMPREIKELNDFFGVDVYKTKPKKYIKPISYPAIIEKDGESEGYNVTVPDIFGGVTCGDSFEDAIYMAKDMIKIMLTEAPGQCFPPKTLEETRANFPDLKVIMVEVDLN